MINRIEAHLKQHYCRDYNNSYGEVVKMIIILCIVKILTALIELVVRECVNALGFHGFDDAVPYIQWLATNKLGVK